MVKGCVRNFFANGAIAQLVEQRTENPCVTGSIPVGTTKGEDAYASSLFCVCLGGFYKLALTDFRIYFEGKMLADKGA